MSEAPDALILAVGNLLMTDDGIAPRVLEGLEQAGGYPGCVLMDGGTGGLGLVALLSERERAILIDAANLDAEPGTVRGFTESEFRGKERLASLSGHQVQLDSVLTTARQCGIRTELFLIGIQPARVEPGLSLSFELAPRLAEITSAVDALIRQRLTQWNTR